MSPEYLPPSWESVLLKQVCDITMGQSPSSGSINDIGRGLPFFQGKSEFTDIYPVNRRYCEDPIRVAEKNNILMSIRAPVGPVNIAKEKCGFGRGICAISTANGVKYKFLFFQLKSMESYVASLGTGTTFAAINREDVENLVIKLAPEKEQSRIVDKLEKLLSELDKGVAELKTAKEKLTQYRQTLLKIAVDGTLTKEWREVNAHKINETGEQLLVRILKERRARWEKQKLEEFASKDQTPPKNWKDKYPEPIAPDTSDLPELPEGWVWASVGQICEIQGGIQKQPKRAPFNNKYPFLRVANVYRNELRLDDIHEIELFAGELNRLRLQQGDILIVEGNGSKTEIGRCALWDESIENAVHQNHLIRARPVLAEGKFIIDWLNSSAGMEIMSSLAATTSGLYTLSVSKISTIPVPIPSILEQQHISNLVFLEFESIENKIKAINASLDQSEAQRKNILKDAFSGNLVEQNPSDEPASVLLEKIKVERDILSKLPKQKNPKKKQDDMNNFDSNALKLWVENHKSDSFSFDDIKMDFQLDYETIKDYLFDLLSDKNPIIKQSFDKKIGKMTFKRIVK